MLLQVTLLCIVLLASTSWAKVYVLNHDILETYCNKSSGLCRLHDKTQDDLLREYFEGAKYQGIPRKVDYEYFPGVHDDRRMPWNRLHNEMKEYVVTRLHDFYILIKNGVQHEYEDYSQKNLFHENTRMIINRRIYNTSKDFMIAMQYKMTGPEFMGLESLYNYITTSVTYGYSIVTPKIISNPLQEKDVYNMTITTISKESYGNEFYVELRTVQDCVLVFDYNKMFFDSITVRSHVEYTAKLSDDKLLGNDKQQQQQQHIPAISDSRDAN